MKLDIIGGAGPDCVWSNRTPGHYCGTYYYTGGLQPLSGPTITTTTTTTSYYHGREAYFTLSSAPYTLTTGRLDFPPLLRQGPRIASYGHYDDDRDVDERGVSMLNMAGGGDGLDQEAANKSAFMEIQQQNMAMGHSPYQIRSPYQTQGQPHDAFSAGQGRGPPLGYPFSMNTMSHTSYQPPSHHPFGMNPYQSPTPPSARDGKSDHGKHPFGTSISMGPILQNRIFYINTTTYISCVNV